MYLSHLTARACGTSDCNVPVTKDPQGATPTTIKSGRILRTCHTGPSKKASCQRKSSLTFSHLIFPEKDGKIFPLGICVPYLHTSLPGVDLGRGCRGCALPEVIAFFFVLMFKICLPHQSVTPFLDGAPSPEKKKLIPTCSVDPLSIVVMLNAAADQ